MASLTKRHRIVGAAVVVLGLIAFVLWKILVPNPLLSAARYTAHALADGDGPAMYEMASDPERECSNLTPEKLHQAWELLVQPVIQASKRVGEREATIESNQTQADAAVKFVNPSGEPLEFIAIVNQTDTTPKGTILYSLLAIATCFDGTFKQGTMTSESSLAALRRYRAKLEAIGLKKVMLNPSRCVTWDELEKIHQYAIEHQ